MTNTLQKNTKKESKVKGIAGRKENHTLTYIVLVIFTLIYSFTDYNYLKGTDKASFVLFKIYVGIEKFRRFCHAVTSQKLSSDNILPQISVVVK